MTDAWKGAHLISAKGIDARKATTLSLASRIAHKRRPSPRRRRALGQLPAWEIGGGGVMGDCNICNGSRQVKVGWHPVNNIKIKVEYDPCPNCTQGPHSFHAKQTADHIRNIRKEATP